MLKHTWKSLIYSFPDYRMLISSSGYFERPQSVANQSDFVSYFVLRKVSKWVTKLRMFGCYFVRYLQMIPNNEVCL